MKKSLFIFLFFIGLLNALSQQKVSIKVFYDKAFKNYTRDTTNKPPSIFKNMDYVLNCNATEARFEIVKKEIPANDLMEYSNNARLGGGNRIYYIDLKTQEHLADLNIFGENFVVKNKADKYTWELVPNETKDIIGYTCYKAIGSYENYNHKQEKQTFYVTAWYSPQLALPFGPLAVNGLPGLILELKKNSFYYIAKKIEFFESPFKIEKPEGKVITEDQLSEKLGNFIKDNKL